MTKYKSRRTPCGNGHIHASAKEARRCDELHILWRTGEISNLIVQPSFDFHIAGKRLEYDNGRAVKYVADWSYIDGRVSELGGGIPKGYTVEDAKGVHTPVYKIKKALMRAVHGIEIREI